MSVPEAMRDRRLRRYPLRHRRIGVPGGQLSMVTPRSLNAVLSQAGRSTRIAGGIEPMPYWAELWATSVAVARLLLGGPSLGGCRLLDLGCGLGLAGIAGGRCGADVLLVDRDPDALRFAAFNAAKNGVGRAATLQLDFCEQAPPGRHDLIVLADVAYEEALHEPLLRVLRRALAAGGRALHADPGREVAGAFLARARGELRVEELSTEVRFEARREQVRLAWMRAPA